MDRFGVSILLGPADRLGVVATTFLHLNGLLLTTCNYYYYLGMRYTVLTCELPRTTLMRES